VQFRVSAKFSDGSERDVTSFAVYESANNLAALSHDGLATLSGRVKTTVLVRYLNQQAPSPSGAGSRSAWIQMAPGAGSELRGQTDILPNFVQLRINPSSICSDDIFPARISLDLLGLLPTSEEARGIRRRQAARQASAGWSAKRWNARNLPISGH